MKKCSKCGIEKELNCFHKNKTQKDGMCSSCKECRKEKTSLYYENNKEKILKYNKIWAQNNPEKSRAIVRKYTVKIIQKN